MGESDEHGPNCGPAPASPLARAAGVRRRRYGRLHLRSYDPHTHVLVRPQRLHLRFPERTTLAEACERLRAAAGELAVSWVVPPHAWKWECGCGGDAFSGLIPCDMHMDADHLDAPSGGVIA